jgi:type I restriction enzyme S subunit
MKLNKKAWSLIEIGSVSKEVNDKLTSLVGYESEKFIRPEDLLIGDLFVKSHRSPVGIGSGKKCELGDILFARRSVSISQFKRRSCILTFDGICSDELTVIRENQEKITKGFLNLILNTQVLWDYAISRSGGSVSKRIKWQDLKKYQFKLPPKDEQEKILSLLLTLEKQIEQTEEQEKNLVELRTKLATELVCTDAQFGNILDEKNCKTSTLGQIAKETRENTKKPLEEGIERFVGLEHIESGKLNIQGWGNVVDGTTFTKVFQVGDVLFGRRRVYLKKTAQADFKGLCSGDITVLRANEKMIIPDLLPYYLSADPVFEFAVSISAGSLSPRAKWRDLSKYEIALPDLHIQEKILEVFKHLDKNINESRLQFSTLKKLKHQLLDEILG